jgi:hypothetical protein
MPGMSYKEKVLIELHSPNLVRVIEKFGLGTITLDKENMLTITQKKGDRVIFQNKLEDIEAIWQPWGLLVIGTGNLLESYYLQFMKHGTNFITTWYSQKKAKEFKAIIKSRGFTTKMPKAQKFELLIFFIGIVLSILIFLKIT